MINHDGKEFAVEKKLLDQVIALTKWHAAQPSFFHGGDQFHENVFLFQVDILPDEFLETVDGYVSHFEVEDDALFIAFDPDDDGDMEYFYYKIVEKTNE